MTLYIAIQLSPSNKGYAVAFL